MKIVLRMKNVLFIAGFFLSSLFSFAQSTFTLSGKVTSGQEPLPGVSVYLENTQEGTLTNMQGEYQLELSQGQHTLLFTYGNTKKVSVDITEDTKLDVDMAEVIESLEEVFLSSIRVEADSPITHSNLTKEEIEDRNLGQDIPTLMNYLPSVVTTSDAGAGIGYSGMRVRGSDGTRINVTINGVPYNDAESQGAFWVNLGDIASSVENLQLQRGVGTSTNGAGAFGASLNILTDKYNEEAYAEVANSFGSYNTHKHTAKFSTGLFNQHWEFSGRASLIESDGYVDRAATELKSYYLHGAYVKDNTLIKAVMFGGTEQTYMAWDGITKDQLKEDRTYNPAGEYTDEDGNIKYYENQTDNYQQDHYQLLWDQRYNNYWSTNVALHYTKGKGFYEEYQEDASLQAYGMQPFIANGEEVTTSDLVNRKWLDNHFYGTTFSLNYKKDKVDAVLGGGWNKYEGDHFGDIIYTRFAQNNDPYEPYYFNSATKTDFNIYSKLTYAINDKLAAYGDLQLRSIKYDAAGPLEEGIPFPIDDSFSFFNPKFGLTYEINKKNQLYASLAVAHREPSRADYENALFSNNEDLKEEKLTDYEFGYRLNSENIQLNANLYYMDYKDQLVLTGEIDAEGAQVRENSGDSYRLGIELDATIKVSDKLFVKPNVALSRNKNKDFTARYNGEQKNFGDTEISYSPSVVAGNIISYLPVKNLELSLLSKYVGEQYMSNIEAEGSKLESYFTTDFNVQYRWQTAPWFKEIVFTGLINNIFDEKYVSNGYFYTYEVENPNLASGLETKGGAGYYPQATINFLAGVTLKF